MVGACGFASKSIGEGPKGNTNISTEVTVVVPLSLVSWSVSGKFSTSRKCSLEKSEDAVTLISKVVTCADWKEKFLAGHPPAGSAKLVVSLAPPYASQKTIQSCDVTGEGA